MKIAILNDTHCGIRNSSEVFMDYQEKFYSEVFFPYLLDHDIKKILHLGDYYENRNSINFKALQHNRKIFLEKLREYHIHMDIIPGNHDTYYKNTNSLNALKELLGHYMNEVYIVEEPTVMDYAGLKVALIPWINRENEEQVRKFLKKCDAPILGAHLELAGFEMNPGVTAATGMDRSIFKQFDMVLSGHYHTKSQEDNIHYLGAQMEFFWNDCGDFKYFHILDTETGQLEAVLNPLTIFEKVYYNDVEKDPAVIDVRKFDGKFVKVIVINKSNPRKFEGFIDRLSQRKLHGLQIMENFGDFMGSNVEDDKISLDDTETLFHTYIEATETDLDKDRIKSLVHELMVEAQTLDVQ